MGFLDGLLGRKATTVVTVDGQVGQPAVPQPEAAQTQATAVPSVESASPIPADAGAAEGAFPAQTPQTEAVAPTPLEQSSGPVLPETQTSFPPDTETTASTTQSSPVAPEGQQPDVLTTEGLDETVAVDFKKSPLDSTEGAPLETEMSQAPSGLAEMQTPDLSTPAEGSLSMGPSVVTPPETEATSSSGSTETLNSIFNPQAESESPVAEPELKVEIPEVMTATEGPTIPSLTQSETPQALNSPTIPQLKNKGNSSKQ